MIIGLTARIAAGKRTFSRYFEEKGFIYYSLSYFLREELKEKGIEITRKNLQDYGNKLREEEGVGVLGKRAREKVVSGKNYIIDGIRNPGEIEELRKIPGFVLISIDAPQEIRFKRFLKRAKFSDPKTWKEFLKIDKRDFGENELEYGQQVGKCMELADYNLINNKDMKELENKIKEVYNIIKNKES